MVSMDGRVLRSVANENGDVDAETRFEFHEEDGVVWARYAGGEIRLGFLVGTTSGTPSWRTTDGERLSFRYTQLLADGSMATGHSEDRIELLDDDRVRLHEEWAWDSQDGSGTSVLEELPPSAHESEREA